MPFPLTVDGLDVPGMQALGFVIASDLIAGGESVRANGTTLDWVTALLPQLTDAERDALVYTLLAFRERRTITLGVQLAVQLQLAHAGPTLLSALATHDLGILLSPGADGLTLEATLARAALALTPLTDAHDRDRVLRALRSAEQIVDEATVLARFGSVDELRTWGPDLLATDDPAVRIALEEGRERAEVADVIATLLD